MTESLRATTCLSWRQKIKCGELHDGMVEPPSSHAQ
ncbi:hypothetical protein M7I_3776 [Glarea lozoyensis 74030]|uniref:Uncharacterized protein n=1 Tax=Glarea lozoyensis (strain ATCC 74030 / MF5533) TaxID=1104152 RepID=H0EME0_GLAL7|nr:hypothetical protein M7I_3776 [Glarea lozoyensis 74030]